MHFPTDINLLSDACRKIIEFASTLSHNHNMPGWRQHRYPLQQHKKHYHKVRNLKHSTSADELQKSKRQHDIEMAHIEYLKLSLKIIRMASVTHTVLTKHQSEEPCLEALNYYLLHARHQVNLIHRRVIEHETIPHAEKVFSPAIPAFHTLPDAFNLNQY